MALPPDQLPNNRPPLPPLYAEPRLNEPDSIIRTSGFMTVEDYETTIDRLMQFERWTEPPRLQLREAMPENRLGDITQRVQERTTAVVAGLQPLVQEGETLAEAYSRVRTELDTKYHHPVMALYYHAVGDAGAGSPDNALSLFVAEDVHNQYLMRSFEQEHPETPNPFAAIDGLIAEGVRPSGFRMVEGEEKFVVDVPMVMRSKSPRGMVVMGCWVDGDTEIEYGHSLVDDCSFNLNFAELRQKKGVSRVIEESDESFFIHEPPVRTFPQ